MRVNTTKLSEFLLVTNIDNLFFRLRLNHSSPSCHFILFSHDYISTDKDRNPGPRILTAYMYLNDVEKGGGTNFPELNVTVMPRRGRLLLWPSVLNDHPDEEDSITMHQALPVEAGEKYGANGWLHLRDFVGSLDSGCA